MDVMPPVLDYVMVVVTLPVAVVPAVVAVIVVEQVRLAAVIQEAAEVANVEAFVQVIVWGVVEVVLVHLNVAVVI